MKKNKKIAVVLLVLLFIFSVYEYRKYNEAKRFFKSIEEEKVIIGIFMTSTFDLHLEYPSTVDDLKKKVKEFINTNEMTNFESLDRGFDILLDNDKYILYSYGLDDKNDSLKNHTEHLPHNFFNFLFNYNTHGDVELFASNKFEPDCNLSILNYKFFDKDYKIINIDSSNNESINKIKKIISDYSIENTIFEKENSFLLFKYSNSTLKIVCSVNVKDQQIHKFLSYLNSNKANLNLDKYKAVIFPAFNNSSDGADL